jgi:hypothetical protein
MPFFVRTRVNTSRIATQLRVADGECRASVAATGRRRWLVSDMSICYLTQYVRYWGKADIPAMTWRTCANESGHQDNQGKTRPLALRSQRPASAGQ